MHVNARQMKVILSMSKYRLTLTFGHMISYPRSDQNDSFQLFFWDINKMGGKDYINSTWEILWSLCTLLEQSYHYYENEVSLAK